MGSVLILPTIYTSLMIRGSGTTNGIIFKINAATLAVTSSITGLNNPYGVAVDLAGNTYISSTGDYNGIS